MNRKMNRKKSEREKNLNQKKLNQKNYEIDFEKKKIKKNFNLKKKISE